MWRDAHQHPRHHRQREGGQQRLGPAQPEDQQAEDEENEEAGLLKSSQDTGMKTQMDNTQQLDEIFISGLNIKINRTAFVSSQPVQKRNKP